MEKDGWGLAPAYDLNPNPHGQGLTLNITENDNRLDLELALEVAESFHLSLPQAKKRMEMIRAAVRRWKSVAERFRLSRSAQDAMASAFQRA